MAVEGIQQCIPGLVAGADLSAKQYYFVKLSAAFTVDVCSAVTDIPIGVLQNDPISGEEARVCAFGLSKVNSDAALAVGNIIGTAADGQAAAYAAGTDTTKYLCGQVVQASTAAGGYATAFINITPNRGA
jgi:hypothetical protein